MKKNLLSSFMLFAAATLFMSCTDPVTPEPTPPTPPDPPVPTTDVVLAPKFAVGSYLEDGKKEGYANFNLALSEVQGTYELEFVAAGKALVLNLYAPISETMDLPVGKYTSLTDVTTVAGPSVVTNLTNGLTIDADKKNTKTHSFKSMTLEVARTGDTYTITFNGVTTGDTKYTCIYTGKLDMTDITVEPEPEKPVLTSFITYEGIKSGGAVYYQLVITDCTVDDKGDPTSAGTWYVVDIYSTPSTDVINWRPEAGVYNHAEWAQQPGTNTFYGGGSSAMPVVEEGGKFKIDVAAGKNMMEGAVTIAHVGEGNFTAALNVKLGDIMYPTAPLTPLELTAGDFKRKGNGPEPEPEPEPIVIKHSIVQYWSAGETSNYTLIMTTSPADENGKPTSAGTQYTVDLYSTLPDDVKNWRPVAGEYNFARSGEAANTFVQSGSVVVEFIERDGVMVGSTNDEMVSGTVTITHVSENNFTAAIDVMLPGGVPVKFTTTEDFVRVNKGGAPVEVPQTTFIENVDLATALTGKTATAKYKETETAGLFCWTVTIGSNVNDGFTMDIYSEAQPTDGIPVGVFESGELEAMPSTFAPGVAARGGRITGTGYRVKTPATYAAIFMGTITISKEVDDYKFDIDVSDEAENTFIGAWTGSVPISEAAPQAVQQKNVRRR